MEESKTLEKFVCWVIAIIAFSLGCFAIYGISALFGINPFIIASTFFGGYVLNRIYLRIYYDKDDGSEDEIKEI